ncbi:MAG: hypothetical protein WBY53_20340 [Acidobacteriaceae bacterium]
MKATISNARQLDAKEAGGVSQKWLTSVEGRNRQFLDGLRDIRRNSQPTLHRTLSE